MPRSKKKYDKAQTPYQRVLASASVDDESKEALRQQMMQLDPIWLLQQVERLQEIFWKHAWKRGSALEPGSAALATSNPQAQTEVNGPPLSEPACKYRRSKKPRKKVALRTWKTRKDVFESVVSEIEALLQKDPGRAATSILKEIQNVHPGLFDDKLLRTLQRRVAAWRREFLAKEQDSLTVVRPVIAPQAVPDRQLKC